MTSPRSSKYRFPPSRATIHMGSDGVRSEVTAGGHSLTVDEPERAGGSDAGPTPFHLLAASLGSCTTITLRMYADRKGWPLEKVEARVEYQPSIPRRRGEADDGDPCRFHMELELTGPLEPAQRERLLEIAHRCPIHRTLAGHAVVQLTEAR